MALDFEMTSAEIVAAPEDTTDLIEPEDAPSTPDKKRRKSEDIFNGLFARSGPMFRKTSLLRAFSDNTQTLRNHEIGKIKENGRRSSLGESQAMAVKAILMSRSRKRLSSTKPHWLEDDNNFRAVELEKRAENERLSALESMDISWSNTKLFFSHCW
jgi:hypothetical protein